jgi:hypothetical protein
MLHDVQHDKGAIPALGIAADTGPWLRPVQYEWKARAAGNAPILRKEARDKAKKYR